MGPGFGVPAVLAHEASTADAYDAWHGHSHYFPVSVGRGFVGPRAHPCRLRFRRRGGFPCRHACTECLRHRFPQPSSSPTSSTKEDGTAKPGTKAKLGEPTLLSYEGGTKAGILEVTITGIEKGSKADVAPLGLSGDAKKMTPYYVRATIKNASEKDLSHAPVDPPGGLLDDGTAARQLLVIGTFATCDSYPKTKSFPPGASYETCAPVLADPGTEVTGAVWTGQGYPDFPASSGVIWTP